MQHLFNACLLALLLCSGVFGNAYVSAALASPDPHDPAMRLSSSAITAGRASEGMRRSPHSNVGIEQQPTATGGDSPTAVPTTTRTAAPTAASIAEPEASTTPRPTVMMINSPTSPEGPTQIDDDGAAAGRSIALVVTGITVVAISIAVIVTRPRGRGQ